MLCNGLQASRGLLHEMGPFPFKGIFVNSMYKQTGQEAALCAKQIIEDVSIDVGSQQWQALNCSQKNAASAALRQ